MWSAGVFITADMSQGRYLFQAAASAHARPSKEEVLSWKKLVKNLVVFFFPFLSAVELDSTGGSMCPGK